MRKRPWKTRTAARSIRLMAFLIAMAFLCGRLGNRYIAPVTTFRDKTQQTIGVLGDFYSSRSSFEIDIYLQTRAPDNPIKVELTDSHAHHTPRGATAVSP